jgi:hypothetical protein
MLDHLKKILQLDRRSARVTLQKYFALGHRSRAFQVFRQALRDQEEFMTMGWLNRTQLGAI